MSYEFFPYTCPACGSVRNAAEVAVELVGSASPVVLSAVAGANGRRRQRHSPGPGRPGAARIRCPGCSSEMEREKLSEHRIPCLRDRLEKLRGKRVRLTPKDPDPYPDFYVEDVGDHEVGFRKGSNDNWVAVDLRKIAGITVGGVEPIAQVRVLGRVVWDNARWRFVPTGSVGRPTKRRLL